MSRVFNNQSTSYGTLTTTAGAGPERLNFAMFFPFMVNFLNTVALRDMLYDNTSGSPDILGYSLGKLEWMKIKFVASVQAFQGMAGSGPQISNLTTNNQLPAFWEPNFDMDETLYEPHIAGPPLGDETRLIPARQNKMGQYVYSIKWRNPFKGERGALPNKIWEAALTAPTTTLFPYSNTDAYLSLINQPVNINSSSAFAGVNQSDAFGWTKNMLVRFPNLRVITPPGFTAAATTTVQCTKTMLVTGKFRVFGKQIPSTPVKKIQLSYPVKDRCEPIIV